MYTVALRSEHTERQVPGTWHDRDNFLVLPAQVIKKKLSLRQNFVPATSYCIVFKLLSYKTEIGYYLGVWLEGGAHQKWNADNLLDTDMESSEEQPPECIC